MKRLYSKKVVFKVKSVQYDLLCMTEPKSEDGYRRRGTAHYARKHYQEAAPDLEQAIRLESNNIDAIYVLSMMHKALRRPESSVSAFTPALELLKDQPMGNKTKNDTLRRLELGHINSITQGDRKLEKEIWQRTT
jgi:tetratricopeptide (TPR) repeat protein